MSRRLLLAMFVGALVLVPSGVAAGGMCHAAEGEMTSSPKSTIRIDDCAFETTVTYVEPGDTVTWISRDVFPHSVTGAAGSWGTEDVFESGDKVSYTFEDEGVYPYYCALHPSMVGAVVVGDATSTAMLEGDGVEQVADAAPVAASDGPPSDSGGGSSTAVLALAAAAVLGAVFAGTRFALARRVAGSA